MKTFLEFLLEYTDPQVMGSEAGGKLYGFLNRLIKKSDGLFVDEDREKYDALLAAFRTGNEQSGPGEVGREADADVLSFLLSHHIEGGLRDEPHLKWSKTGRTEEKFYVDQRGVSKVMKTSGQKRKRTVAKWERPEGASAVSKKDLAFSSDKGDDVRMDIVYDRRMPTRSGGYGDKFTSLDGSEDIVFWSGRSGPPPGQYARQGDVLDVSFSVKDAGVFRGRKSITGDRMVVHANKTDEERKVNYKKYFQEFQYLSKMVSERFGNSSQEITWLMGSFLDIFGESGDVNKWPEFKRHFLSRIGEHDKFR